MKQFFIFCSILIVSGCCGSEVVLRKFEIKSPGIVDSLDAEKSCIEINKKDSILAVDIYRGIKLREGSKKDTALVAEFIPALKKFVIKIAERIDTLIIRDTIRIKPTDIILRGEDNTEKLIWIISFTLTTIFIIIYKRYLNA